MDIQLLKKVVLPENKQVKTQGLAFKLISLHNFFYSQKIEYRTPHEMTENPSQIFSKMVRKTKKKNDN